MPDSRYLDPRDPPRFAQTVQGALEYERFYAYVLGVSVEHLRQAFTVRRCRCGEWDCPGYKMLKLRTNEHLAYDADARRRRNPPDPYSRPHVEDVDPTGGAVAGSPIPGRP